MEHKTIYQLVGGRDDFRFIRAASHVEPNELPKKLREFKLLGHITIVRPSGAKLSDASNFISPDARNKYFQGIMAEYFEYGY